MKMKMFTMLCALSLGTTAAFAQKGVEDGSRFGHGEDSIRCLQNISIYSEYVKTDQLYRCIQALDGCIYRSTFSSG